jgi:hypothetical protein
MVDSEDSEEYPEGYEEALAECTVLAARLLRVALQHHQEAPS